MALPPSTNPTGRNSSYVHRDDASTSAFPANPCTKKSSIATNAFASTISHDGLPTIPPRAFRSSTPATAIKSAAGISFAAIINFTAIINFLAHALNTVTKAQAGVPKEAQAGVPKEAQAGVPKEAQAGGKMRGQKAKGGQEKKEKSTRMISRSFMY